VVSLVLSLVNIVCFMISYNADNYGLAAFNTFAAGWCLCDAGHHFFSK
jgi:hypothetical protein